jgi:hypothetical protein
MYRHTFAAAAAAAGFVVWEVAMAAVPWAGQMMGAIMHTVMVLGQRLQFGPGVPQVSRSGGVREV